MSEILLAEFNIRRPDLFLGAGSGTHVAQTYRVMAAFDSLPAEMAPDVVVVGDVNSKFCDGSTPEAINRILNDPGERVEDPPEIVLIDSHERC